MQKRTFQKSRGTSKRKTRDLKMKFFYSSWSWNLWKRKTNKFKKKIWSMGMTWEWKQKQLKSSLESSTNRTTRSKCWNRRLNSLKEGFLRLFLTLRRKRNCWSFRMNKWLRSKVRRSEVWGNQSGWSQRKLRTLKPSVRWFLTREVTLSSSFWNH